jgi:thiamine biosynthesis lipoprotein
MSKTSSEAVRQALHGPTMGTCWQAAFYAPPGFDPGSVRGALQDAVDMVDRQMSTWKPDSTLMHLNRAAVDEWVAVPAELVEVLRLGLEIGRASGGAFDIGTGDAVRAWGFGTDAAETDAIRAAMAASRPPAHEIVDIDDGRVRKRAPIMLDLNGIAKGYGVDRLTEILCRHGITDALTGIDGEMRASGRRVDGAPWTVAVEAPNPERRAPHSILALEDAAAATSGDYRHRVTVKGRYLSHTMDPRRGVPLLSSPASVTVVARSCAEADGWATALIVLGPDAGGELAARRGLDALFLTREAGSIQPFAIGPLFNNAPTSTVAATC